VDNDVEQAGAKLMCVDPRLVHRIWPHVAPLLRRAIAKTGLSAFADIEREMLDGKALLWIATSGESGHLSIDAVASTILQQTDAGKVCVITACSGTRMACWLPLIANLEAYARDEGCRSIHIFGRLGWQRVLDGYRRTNVVLDKPLQGEPGFAACRPPQIGS
jgi:hypothetical protein